MYNGIGSCNVRHLRERGFRAACLKLLFCRRVLEADKEREEYHGIGKFCEGRSYDCCCDRCRWSLRYNFEKVLQEINRLEKTGFRKTAKNHLKKKHLLH